MYAELCLKVQPKCPVFKENGRDQVQPYCSKPIIIYKAHCKFVFKRHLSYFSVVQNFRRLLLNKCQEEFEKKAKATEELEALEGEARLEKELKIKLRMLGSILKLNVHFMTFLNFTTYPFPLTLLSDITFIGELFKLQMLTEKIIHECVIHVLLPPKPALDDLELFCKLMSTIGKTLELKSKVYKSIILSRERRERVPSFLLFFPSPFLHTHFNIALEQSLQSYGGLL